MPLKTVNVRLCYFRGVASRYFLQCKGGGEMNSKTSQAKVLKSGFTLLEMMISIVLVMLIMLLFAKIFDVVANTMSTQKGMAVNDQKARTFSTIIREDIKHRTFRRVVPFFPGQNTGKQPGPFYTPQDRRGYFSISENDPNNPTDDVLAFTAQYDIPVAGRAGMLDNLLVEVSKGKWVLGNQNQPEFDDGVPPETKPNGTPELDGTGKQITNLTGVSRTVEIVYFLRHGNLYRRVMLVREPYDDPTNEGVQPGELMGDFTVAPSFWNYFDYSAYRIFSGDNVGVKFHDAAKALNIVQPPNGAILWDHDGDDGTSAILLPPSLGIPHLRFGHSLSRLDGTPREFVNKNKDFIGRFTTQETAHSLFGYPGTSNIIDDPHNNNVTLKLNSVGRVEPFHNEITRRGEDILLSNVHEFDIKVWDDYDEIDLNRDNFLDPNEDFNGNETRDRVMDFVDLGHNRTVNGEPVGYYNQQPFPNPVGGQLGWINKQYGNRYDTWHPFDQTPLNNADPPPFGNPPYRPLSPFNGEDRQPGTFEDDDLSKGLNDPGEQGWLGSDDEVPLKAIQITIRFFDVTSDQMRQVTLIFSLKP